MFSFRHPSVTELEHDFLCRSGIFGFDAAILFSDILVVPHALGQRVTFERGEGPRLDALKDPTALDGLLLLREVEVELDDAGSVDVEVFLLQIHD